MPSDRVLNFVHSVSDALSDPVSSIVHPALDSILSVEGAMLTVGSISLLYSTSAIVPFFSSGEKNWMSGYEAWRKGLYGDPKKGITLGRYKGRLICYDGGFHVSVDGTTGTGKTACAFLSTLLLNETYSFIVFDQSGDLYKLTSGRRSQLGPVYYLKPGYENTDFYNPLDDIPDDDRIFSNLKNMLDPLFSGSAEDQKKAGGDPFFDRNPRDILPFIFMQVMYGDDPSIKNIAGVLKFMSDEMRCFSEMAQNPRHHQCGQIGLDMLAMSDPTRSSLVAVMKGALSLWRDDTITHLTSKSSFKIEELATSTKGPVTIYLGAPAIMVKQMMPAYVMLEQMLSLHLLNDAENTLSGKKKTRPVIICDDEAQNSKRPNLSKFEIYRKYGVWGFFGCQSLDAMAQMYGEHTLELFKLKVSHRPTVGSKVTDRISKMSGSYRKKEISESESHGARNNSRSRSWKWVDKPRLSASDLEKWLEYGRGLLTHPGRPAVLEMYDAKQDPEFKPLIIEPYVPTSFTTTLSTWERVSRPVIMTIAPEPEPHKKDHSDDEDLSADPMQMILMMEGGGNTSSSQENPVSRKKRKVIA